MSHEREFDRNLPPTTSRASELDVAPNRETRSARLDAPAHPIASGLVQRQSDGNGVAGDAEQAVARAASASSGAALPATVMRKFEASLGADLSSVRVHTGGESAAAAGAVGARAYTVGQDIHFNAGQFDPSSHGGEHLLAHEVAHTVQQTGGAPRPQYKLAVSSPGDALEGEADRAADAMVSGASFAVTMASGVQRKVFRQEKKDFSGSSAARHGPDGSALENRRAATMTSAAYAEQYDNTCLDAAKKITAGVAQLYGVAAAIEKRAADKPKDGEKIDKGDLMQLAKQLKDTAKALEGMKQGWDTLKAKKFDFSKSNLAQEPELPKVLDVLKASSDSITQGFQTSAALSSFQSNPSRDTAKAWADNVAKQFTAAKKIVGALPFPPYCDFMKQYFEGLLGAPAAYISAFQTIAAKRYDELDKEMGGANTDQQLEELGKGVIWTGGGPVQKLVHQSYTAPNGGELYSWLKAHKTIQGVDMQKQPPFERAKALFVMALGGDESKAADRDAWVAWINAFGG